MGMRDLLIIIVIVGIILILLDGYRRKRKDSIRVQINKNIPPVDDDLIEAAELPNGGARVVPRDGDFDHDQDEEYSDDDYQAYDDEYDHEQEDEEDAEEVESEEDEEQIVPVLMDAVEIDKDLAATSPREQSHYSDESDDGFDEEDSEADSEEDTNTNSYDEEWDDEDEDEDEDTDTDTDIEESHLSATSSHYSDDTEMADEDDEYVDEYEDDGIIEEGDHDSFDVEDISPVRVKKREEGSFNQSSINTKSRASNASKSAGRIEPTLGEMESFSADELDDGPSRMTSSKTKKQEKKQKKKSNEAPEVLQVELFSETPEDFIQNDEGDDDSQDDFQEPEEVIVINVMAKQGELFAGSDLLPIIMQHGMRLGKMSIFHKHAGSSDNGPFVFSMANMVKPGTFDVTQMEEFSTPGVSFFLQLPNAFGNMKSFEQMLSAANSIKESLNGDLKDEHRSVITRQTIEHCRQRIQDFELAQLSKK